MRNDSRKARNERRVRRDVGRGLFPGTLAVWLVVGAAAALVTCRTPIPIDPPAPCPMPSLEAEAQLAALPDGSDLVIWIDALGVVCDEIDDLRGGP
jgi:hypothetical protein